MENFSADAVPGFVPGFKGVIFDLDGTLLDSMKIWESVDRDFLTENQKKYTPDVSEAVKKMTISQSADYFRKRFGLSMKTEEIIARIEEMVSEKYRFSIPLKEGALDTVKKLYKNKIKLCVATATYNSLADAALKRLKIYDMLEFVLTSSDVGSGKDNPDIFIKSAEKLRLPINEVLIIEDSLHCIQAAKSAGFTTAAVYDDISSGEWEEIKKTSDFSVMKIHEITEIIGGLAV